MSANKLTKKGDRILRRAYNHLLHQPDLEEIPGVDENDHAACNLLWRLHLKYFNIRNATPDPLAKVFKVDKRLEKLLE